MRTLYAFLVSLALASSVIVADQLPLPFQLRVSTAADVTAPVVTISSPTSSATYDNGATATVDISGSATDAVGVSSCTWSNAATGGSGGTIGAASWSIAAVQLASGTNAITITCIDTSNNSSNDVITVTYTPVVSGSNNCNGPCLFETSFTVAQGWSADAAQRVAGCGGAGTGFDGIQNDGAGTLVGNWGDWTANSVEPEGCDTVDASANYSGGGGGRGHRHARGDGTNTIGGGLKMEWVGNHQNLSICYRVRYRTGFHFLNTEPHYIKDMYLAGNSSAITGYHGNGMGANIPVGGTNHFGALTWTSLWGAVSDGSWHETAYFFDVTNNKLWMWIDDALIINNKTVAFGAATVSGGMSNYMYTSNLSMVDNDADGVGVGDSTATINYTDFDDIVVDTNVTNGGKLEC